MPHDKNGKEIVVGDRVLVECVVESIVMQADYCNVGLKTVDSMPPYDGGTSLHLNAKQVVKKP